ncbi:hypothetical protein KsCSTR_34160 [Candidatus Kuenenia stuttgartiensis]|uniref:Uncharacterized protein n=1 Tax=Kuenenia stuttgartiensis TaxID=174633 RepID=Q1Q494_KUEST|nr:hypothetical protein KsCSTR_34160 [Candidatus Kuenenia stuttgartiensis]CAJ74827.1 unknown protein [Candidatus Kuenenia stuttgartiensis]
MQLLHLKNRLISRILFIFPLYFEKYSLCCNMLRHFLPFLQFLRRHYDERHSFRHCPPI